MWHILKKFLMENFSFCVVLAYWVWLGAGYYFANWLWFTPVENVIEPNQIQWVKSNPTGKIIPYGHFSFLGANSSPAGKLSPSWKCCNQWVKSNTGSLLLPSWNICLLRKQECRQPQKLVEVKSGPVDISCSSSGNPARN